MESRCYSHCSIITGAVITLANKTDEHTFCTLLPTLWEYLHLQLMCFTDTRCTEEAGLGLKKNRLSVHFILFGPQRISMMTCLLWCYTHWSWSTFTSPNKGWGVLGRSDVISVSTLQKRLNLTHEPQGNWTTAYSTRVLHPSIYPAAHRTFNDL